MLHNMVMGMSLGMQGKNTCFVSCKENGSQYV